MQIKHAVRWANLPSDFYNPISVALTLPDNFTQYMLHHVSMIELEHALKLDRVFECQIDHDHPPGDLFGQPTLFAIGYGKIWLCPIPDQDYQLEVVYFSQPKSC